MIRKRLGTSLTPPKPAKLDEVSPERWEAKGDDDEDPRMVLEVEDTVDANGRLINQQPAYDKLIHAEVQLQKGDDFHTAKVIGRALDPNGSVVGQYDLSTICVLF